MNSDHPLEAPSKKANYHAKTNAPGSSSWKATLLAAAAFAAGMAAGSSPDAPFRPTRGRSSRHRIDRPRRTNAAFLAAVGRKTFSPSSSARRGDNAILRGVDVRGLPAAEYGFDIAAVATTSLSGDRRSSRDAAAGDEMPRWSESEAIEILRASPRRDDDGGSELHSTKKACRTATDVLSLLHGTVASPPLLLLPDDDNDDAADVVFPSERALAEMMSEEGLRGRLPSSVVGPIADAVGPNVAAAALRRLISPPFLRPPSSDHHSGVRERRRRSSRRRGKKNDASEESERDVRARLVEALLEKVSDAMECQSRDDLPLASSAVVAIVVAGRHDDDFGLLPHDDSWMVPPATTSSSGNDPSRRTLNWYALADLLYSLSNLCACDDAPPRDRSSIVNLFDDVVRYLSRDERIASSFARCVGARRLVRDVLLPLASIEAVRRKADRDTRAGVYDVDGELVIVDARLKPFPLEAPEDAHRRLLGTASSYLVLPHALAKLNAVDLSATLGALSELYRPRGGTLAMRSAQRTLLRGFMKRLRKYPVRSAARGGELVRAVRSVARLIGHLEETDRQRATAARALHVPLRLPGEEEEGSVDSPPRAGGGTAPEEVTGIPTETLREEAIVMFHTLVNEVVNPPAYSDGKINDDATGGDDDDPDHRVEGTKLPSLSPGQIGDVLRAATSLGVPRDDIAPAVAKMLERLTSPSVLRRFRGPGEISRTLLTLQRLRVGTGIYDDAAALGEGDACAGGVNDEAAEGLEERCVRLLGERFLEIIEHRRRSRPPRHACDGRTLATVLRSCTMMFRGNSTTATTAALDAASMLILDGTEGSSSNDDDDDNGDDEEEEDWFLSTSFLSMCNEFEVSNCLFAFALARRFDEGTFVALTDQMTEDYVLENCSPSSASRAMWSCSMLLSLDEAKSYGGNSYNKQNDFYPGIGGGSYLHERRVDLFHQLAPLLLFSPLSPTDASCAMWAMAKAQYVVDRGVFDRLAASLASEEMLQRSNARLISQALWSCGRMSEFEDPSVLARRASDGDEDDDDGPDPPPYVKCADEYVHFLVENRSQMTPRHVAQAIWAMGRLRLSDPVPMREMADVASRLELNPREIANVVWALGRVGHDDPTVVLGFVRRAIASPDDVAAQEAACMLFALGKFRIRDRGAYASLSSILRNRLHEATSQAMANALWAHEAVGLEPPPELLSTWAQDRLGMAIQYVEPHEEHAEPGPNIVSM